MLVSGGSSIRHVGLLLGMLVSNVSQIRHVGLWSSMWISDHACRSPMGGQSGMSVSDVVCRFQMGFQWRMGLRSGMLVSDGRLIKHVGLRWVSDWSLICLWGENVSSSTLPPPPCRLWSIACWSFYAGFIIPSSFTISMVSVKYFSTVILVQHRCHCFLIYWLYWGHKNNLIIGDTMETNMLDWRPIGD